MESERAGSRGRGQSNSNAMFFPAGAHHAVGVAATDAYNIRASYSNYGNTVAIAAPGSLIYSTTRGGGYTTLSGTSMATPHGVGSCRAGRDDHPGRGDGSHRAAHPAIRGAKHRL